MPALGFEILLRNGDGRKNVQQKAQAILLFAGFEETNYLRAEKMDEKEGMVLSDGNFISEEERKITETLIDALAPVVFGYALDGMKTFFDLWEEIKEIAAGNPYMFSVQQLQAEENRRIVHLMYNHKKERVRKKNFHRFCKLVERKKESRKKQMDKIDKIAKVYSENVDCSDCAVIQECYYENGEVFSDRECAEFVKKIIKSEVKENDGRTFEK